MKKLLGIVVLALLWCNVGVADVRELVPLSEFRKTLKPGQVKPEQLLHIYHRCSAVYTVIYDLKYEKFMAKKIKNPREMIELEKFKKEYIGGFEASAFGVLVYKLNYKQLEAVRFLNKEISKFVESYKKGIPGRVTDDYHECEKIPVG